MYINTNKQELLELAKYFYNITHTLISIYDKDQNLLCSYPGIMCDFCTEVRRSNELHSMCLQCDKTALEICRQTRQTYIYHCHMGLIEVATPIVYNHMILGYLLFGQITDEKDKHVLLPGIQSIVAKHGLDINTLTADLEKINYCSTEYIQSISRLLEMCANYIWLNSIISVKKEGIAYSIDMYILEHISEELTIPELCRRFGISRSTLYEISLENFGCSISKRIQNHRNECAKKLLKDREMTVSEVAWEVGMKDVNYFIRSFKKLNGCTPKAYQKKISESK